MPPNTRAYLVRRVHQADGNVKRAMEQLAEVWATLVPQHPNLALALELLLYDLDAWRGTLRQYYAHTLKGPTMGLHTAGDLAETLVKARPVPSPERKG